VIRLYDVKIDEWREVTQKDVDMMDVVCQAYGRIRSAVWKRCQEPDFGDTFFVDELEQIHLDAQEKVRQISERDRPE